MKGENIYEELAEKTLQWEPTNEESRTANPISSKRGIHLIEDFKTTEAKFANIMQRLEAIETKRLVPVSQVSPTLSSTTGCTYCRAMNHVFEDCPIFQDQQMLTEPMNAAFSRPHNNPCAPTYNPG